MSRRKQARPVRLLEEDEDENNVGANSTTSPSSSQTVSTSTATVISGAVCSGLVVRTTTSTPTPSSSGTSAVAVSTGGEILNFGDDNDDNDAIMISTAPGDGVSMAATGSARPESVSPPAPHLASTSPQRPVVADNPSPFAIEQNCGENSNSSEEEINSGASGSLPPETHMCPRCHEQFTEVPEFIAHRTICDNKARLHHEPAHSDPEDMVVSGDEDEDECGGKRLEEVRRHRQDAANNNSVDDDENDGANSNIPSERQTFPFPVPPAAAGHVTLEALQNTKVAVAQFAATAMANNTDNEAALQELAVLQSTLFTLQHQQVFQLQLINQLQRQLSLNRPKESTPPSPPVSEGPSTVNPPTTTTPTLPISIPQQPPLSLTPSPRLAPRPLPTTTPPVVPIPATLTPTSTPSIPVTQPLISKPDMNKPLQPPPPITTTASVATSTITSTTPPAALTTQPPLCSISSSLASTIITNNDPPPSLDEPNTLEMLQRRAQEVLDNASQGLLASNLADELAFRKGKGSMSPYDGKSGRNEPFFKHRCRYCGKVFGSDSALQIHIRSHTGERPFKCNVCGSRFTTKGNLKVHFQRHTAKFPHIKMNPNPVPEHLDKYHPPLLAQLGQNRPVSPGMPPHPPPHPLQFPGAHHPFPLYRPPGPHDLLPPRPLTSPQRPPPEGPLRTLPPHPIFLRRDEQEVPENLSKPPRSPSPSPPPPPSRELTESRCKSEPLEVKPEPLPRPPSPRENETQPEVPEITPKQEPETDHEQEPEPEPEQETQPERVFQSPTTYDECSMESKYSNEDMMEHDPDSPMEHEQQDVQDQPENLSSKSQSITTPLSISTGQRIPASFPFSHTASPPSSTSSGSLGTHDLNFPIPPPGSDPARDPAVYTNLLPRPGSNDNSWESLIEVTKTSETSKLQQLVDNIEHKLTDPNQCVICHRVLSCKSALQMHYRTHTGERPFKCKICGRAFTTKGNLKTHMGVHRAKPPMRVLHQCPVCHKKFTNALVLQQHIRLHTGEPTDLTPEQIQAAEIKDFPSPGGFPLPNSINPFLNQGFPPIPGLSPLGPPGFPPMGYKPGDYDHMKDDVQDFMEEDEEDDDRSSTTTEQPMPSFSTSLAALENQVRTITTMASQLSASGLSRSNDDLCSNNSRLLTSTPNHQNGEKSPDGSMITSPNGSEPRCSPSQMSNIRPPSSQRADSPTPSESNSLGALDLTPRSSQQHHPHQTPQPIHSPGPSPGPPIPAPPLHPPPGVFSNFGLLPPVPPTNVQPPPLMTSALSSLTSSVLTSTAFSPLGMAVGPAVRGNTTCNICFKTFACNSALEIHYRSHTKERPFKCTVCDRGFSTKGKSEECLCSSGQQGRIQDDGGPQKSKRKRPNEYVCMSTTTTTSTSATSSTWPPTLFPNSSSGYASASEWIRPIMLGNMKQHMLTHKIRDMPQHMFDKPSSTGPPGVPPPIPPTSILPPPSAIKEDSRNSHGSIINIPERPENLNSCSSEATSQILERDRELQLPPLQTQLPPPEIPLKAEMSLMKRSPPESELPLPKRQPNLSTTPPSSGIALLRECVRFAGGGVSPIMQQQQQAAAAAAAQSQNQSSNQQPPTSQSSSTNSQQQQQNNKHLCHVCNKNFSSSSALQIHMRTHTGDKPFRCNVCQKAFTTKGNLKVHMGTHMWSNGASRRGRRMSLDLPPIPMTPKDSEFLQRRPDLFYPYLPAPFLNGMQQKNPGNGLPSPGKYASLLGFGYPPVSEPLRSQPTSPLSDKPPSSVASSPPRDGNEPPRPPRDVLPRVWDLHYERQTASEEEVVSPSNGTINVPTPTQLGVPPPPRGEGLAA